MSEDPAPAPAKRDHPVVEVVCRFLSIFLTAAVLGLLSRFAVFWLGQSADVANTVGGLAALLGAYVGWRFWRKITGVVLHILGSA